MPVQLVRPKRLYQVVAEEMLRLIHAGEWPPGGRLPAERDLAASLNVSRPTVREAMIALELAGAIEIRTGSGIYVAEQQADVQTELPDDQGPGPFELIEARYHVEGESAALAATRITEAELAELERLNEAMEERTRRNLSSEEFDWQFHRTIAEATRNSAIVFTVNGMWRFRERKPLWRKLHDMIRVLEDSPDWSDDARAVLDHRKIIAALRTGDPDKARDAMRAHLARVKAALLAASGMEEGRSGQELDSGWFAEQRRRES